MIDWRITWSNRVSGWKGIFISPQHSELRLLTGKEDAQLASTANTIRCRASVMLAGESEPTV